MMKPIFKIALAICTAMILTLNLSSCTVVKVVDTAASAAIGVTKGAVKVTGAAVSAAIPDGDDEDKDEKNE